MDITLTLYKRTVFLQRNTPLIHCIVTRGGVVLFSWVEDNDGMDVSDWIGWQADEATALRNGFLQSYQWDAIGDFLNHLPEGANRLRIIHATRMFLKERAQNAS